MKFLLLLALLPLAVFSQTLNVVSPVRYLALGDSYTIGESVPQQQNFPNQLRNALNGVSGISFDTVNVIATTGWTTNNLTAAIAGQNLENGGYNLVSLLIGVNNQYQGRPFSEFEVQFPALVDSSVRYAHGDKSHVFIVSIPDYAYTPFGVQTGNQSNISNQIDNYNSLIRSYADSADIKYIDVTTVSRHGLAEPTLVAQDGLHPSSAQYGIWVDSIIANIDSPQLTNSISTINPLQKTLVYPNPTSGQLIIDLPENTLNGGKNL